ncbi:MAG: iron-containing redox enzyme family protein [Candidatus Tectomicrobia bacterium]
MVSTVSVGAEQSARAFLKELREAIKSHPGVGHSLLGRMLMDPRTTHDFKVLASQHYPLVANFTAYMELLLLRAPTSEAKCWIAKVLVDEYGGRSEGADHPKAYRTFMHAAGIEPGTEGDFPLHPAVVDFITEHYRICTEEPFLVGLGAVGPGHEWSIPTMFEHVLIGLHKAGFHEEAIAYWTMHLDQDEDHGAWLEEALVEYCDTAVAREHIRCGATLSLNARETFWWGVMDKMHTELTKSALPGIASAASGAEAAQPTFNQVRENFAISLSFGRER